MYWIVDCSLHFIAWFVISLDATNWTLSVWASLLNEFAVFFFSSSHSIRFRSRMKLNENCKEEKNETKIVLLFQWIRPKTVKSYATNENRFERCEEYKCFVLQNDVICFRKIPKQGYLLFVIIALFRHHSLTHSALCIRRHLECKIHLNPIHLCTTRVKLHFPQRPFILFFIFFGVLKKPRKKKCH